VKSNVAKFAAFEPFGSDEFASPAWQTDNEKSGSFAPGAPTAPAALYVAAGATAPALPAGKTPSNMRLSPSQSLDGAKPAETLKPCAKAPSLRPGASQVTHNRTRLIVVNLFSPV